MAQIRDGRARIVYCSPERFAQPGFMNAVGQREVDLLAVDEAHCISEWGHDFRPDYLRLPRVLERLGRPTVMACTATATEDVSSEIAQRLGLHDPLMIRAGFDRPNLSFDIVQFEGKGSKARKLAMLLHGLRDEANRPAIVYCGTRKDTEEVAQSLREAGLSAAGYHAGMDPDERASAQHRFMTGDAEVITATNAFGMGVDKANVRSVWHWAIPTSVEAYYQEAGRAGRDGLPARAVLLAGRSDLGRLVRFIQMREVEPESVSLYAQRLKAGSDSATAAPPSTPRASTRTGSSWRSPSEPAPSRWSPPPEAAWSSASTTGSTWPPPEPPARRPRTAPGAPTARSSRSASERAAGAGGCSTTSGTRPRARRRAAAATSAIRSRGCRRPRSSR